MVEAQHGALHEVQIVACSVAKRECAKRAPRLSPPSAVAGEDHSWHALGSVPHFQDVVRLMALQLADLVNDDKRVERLRVLRPAGREVEKHESLYTCGFLSVFFWYGEGANVFSNPMTHPLKHGTRCWSSLALPGPSFSFIFHMSHRAKNGTGPPWAFIFLRYLSLSFIILHCPSVSFSFLSVSFSFFQFLSFSFHFLSFSFSFFHSLSFTFIHFHSLSFTFLHFPSLSFTFLHFFTSLSFHFIFFHFLSFLSFTFIHFHSLSVTFIYFHLFSFIFSYFHFLSFSFFFLFLFLCWVLKI